MTQTSAPDRKVPTRRISFEESLQDLPRHFAADGDLILSHLAAALSSVFPDGEDFFVRSVRHYRDQITDPELKRQVAGFIGQEAMHGREHRALNDRLDELGYPTKTFERLTKRGLALRERVAPPMSNLAATAALEHFTATLAELLLTSDEARGAVRPRRGPQPVPVARARGVRAQGRRLRRLQGGRRQRAHAGVDDEAPRSASSSASPFQVAVSLARDASAYRPRRPAGQLAPLPALADHAAAPLAPAAATTTAPTSTPTTTTPPTLVERVAGRAVRRRRHAQRQAGHRAA